MLIRRWVLLMIALGLSVGVLQAAPPQQEGGGLRNPLNLSGPDPWLQYYDGYYYLATTTGSSSLTMRRSPTLGGLKTSSPVQIYAETEPSRCCNMWAPEFHLLDGPNGPRWYYYYSAGTSDTLDNQHTHVLESAGTDPMGPYTYKARIFDPVNDTWAIDGSILQIDGALYFLFSSWVGPNQSLFIAPMSDPWTLSGPRVLIAEPQYDWERIGLNVNEGPVALYHQDKVFIIYSASYCATPDYSLGMLTWTGGDPLSPQSWVKHPEPLFERSDANGVFGPGHNGFFTSPDGTENWIVYHANDSAAGVCDPQRTTRVQKFTWNEDGTPNFGVPVPLTETIALPSGDTGGDPMPDITQALTRFAAYGLDEAYLRHVDVAVRVDFTINPAMDARFFLRSGLAETAAVSIEAANMPGYYLRHQGNAIVFAPNDGSAEFAAAATWWRRPGLADPNWTSFESYSQPGKYIGQQFGVMALVDQAAISTNRARADATFQLEGG
ncbi:MAG TPA: family 43 glycosylhydrolase [Aggregatilineales bacterium]|nr:family 43 glycosylhydrolase [Aggregatilineales bacterium]